MLLKNLGNGKYADVAMAVGAGDIRDARAAAIADFDNDGDFDIVVNHNPGIKQEIAPMLLRNDIGNQHNWLEVELIGASVNRDAAGSEVRIELPDGRRMLRHIMVGSSYASQRSRRLDFGIGNAERISRLTVKWIGPGGGESVFENFEANQILRIVQGTAGQPATLTKAPVREAVKAAQAGSGAAANPTHETTPSTLKAESSLISAPAAQ